MDSHENTLEHNDELVPSTHTSGYEDFEVRLDNAEDEDVKRHMDVNDDCQNVRHSSGPDDNGIISPSNQNNTQEEFSDDDDAGATIIVAPATSFRARFGRSDGTVPLVRSENNSQNAASQLDAVPSHRSVRSSNDISTHSMDEEDRTESAALEHQSVAETKAEERGGEGGRQPGRPQWAQSWTGDLAVEENMVSHCGATHSSTFSLRSIDAECQTERPATAQPKSGEEKLEEHNASSSFGTRWRQPRRPALAQSWTVVRAVDEATEHTGMGLPRDAPAVGRYEPGSLFPGGDSSEIANKSSQSTASGQPVDAHHLSFPPPMGHFRSVPLTQSAHEPTGRDTPHTAAKFSDMTMAYKQDGVFSSTSYADNIRGGFFFPPPTGYFRSSSLLQNLGLPTPVDLDAESGAKSCLAQKISDETTASKQEGGFSAGSGSSTRPEGFGFPPPTGNFRSETASLSTADQCDFDFPHVEDNVGSAARTVPLNGLISTVESLTASLGGTQSDVKPKASMAVTAPRDRHGDLLREAKCVTLRDNDWGALDLTLEHEGDEIDHFSVHVSKLAELLNGYRVMDSFEFAGISFDDSYSGALMQLREDFFRQCCLVMHNCDFRKMDPTALATLFTSLIVYRVSIVGDIKFPEGCNLFDVQTVKSTLSLTFRRDHDADPTTSLPKVEAAVLVTHLYSELKPRYVLLDGSQLSPDIDALITAILEEEGKTESSAQFVLDVRTDRVPEALAGGALVLKRRLTFSISHDALECRLVLKRFQRGGSVRSTTIECVMRSLGGSSPEHIRLTDERVRWTLIHLFGSKTTKTLKRSIVVSVPDTVPIEDPNKKEFLSFIESSFDRIYNIANEERHLDNHIDDCAMLLVEQFHQKVDQ